MDNVTSIVRRSCRRRRRQSISQGDVRVYAICRLDCTFTVWPGSVCGSAACTDHAINGTLFCDSRARNAFFILPFPFSDDPRSITVLSILFAARVCTTNVYNGKSTPWSQNTNCFRIHLAARWQQIGGNAHGSERLDFSGNYWFSVRFFVCRFFCFVLFVLPNEPAAAAATAALHQSFCWRGEKYVHYVNFFVSACDSISVTPSVARPPLLNALYALK